MQGIALMLGHKGPIDGDPYVAELLRRTFDGYIETLRRFTQARQDHLGEQLSPYAVSLHQMTILHIHWRSLVEWEMAIAYLDGAIAAHKDAESLPRSAYEQNDALCDTANSLHRSAIKLSGEYRDKGSILLSQLIPFNEPHLSTSYVNSAWHAGLAVIDRVKKDLRLLATRTVPRRMVALHDDLLKQAALHDEVIDSLKRDWRATSIPENKADVVTELYVHVRDMYEIGQKLWAPYLTGQPFNEALKRKTTLDELEEEFDPWILSDPQKRPELKSQQQARAQLAEFWESLADRSATIQLAHAVNTALASDRIRRRTGRGYPQLPWPSQFMVRQTVTFGTRTFEPGGLCAFYTAEDTSGKKVVEVRKSGRLASIIEQLGQAK